MYCFNPEIQAFHAETADILKIVTSYRRCKRFNRQQIPDQKMHLTIRSRLRQKGSKTQIPITRDDVAYDILRQC